MVAALACTACLRTEELDLLALDIGMISNQPLYFLHQEVDVTGDVEDVFAARAFTLEDPGVFDDREVLVIVRPGALEPGQLLEPDQKVRVRGEVRQYVVDELVEAFPEHRLDTLHPHIRFQWAAPVILVDALWLDPEGDDRDAPPVLRAAHLTPSSPWPSR